MASTVKCPKCGSLIEITDALKSEEREKIIKEIEEQTLQKAKADFEFTLKKAETDAESARESIAKLKSQQDQMFEENKKLKQQKELIELDAKKRILAAEEEIRKDAQSKAEETQRLKFMEMQNQLQGALKSNSELRQKLEQGSQQLQGEVQEMDLKQKLTQSFPDDVIEDVEKGVRGADLSQSVRTRRGNICGIILWESKRTKSWSDDWITKLKDDMRSVAANTPVIVTAVMPKEIPAGLGLLDGVWITKPEHAEGLAFALRDKLIEVAKTKFYSQDRSSKADETYNYVTGHEFVQQIQALAEVYKENMDQIEQEKRAFERIWKAREGQAKRLLTGAVNIYGKVQGIAGITSLPSIPILELDSGQD